MEKEKDKAANEGGGHDGAKAGGGKEGVVENVGVDALVLDRQRRRDQLVPRRARRHLAVGKPCPDKL